MQRCAPEIWAEILRQIREPERTSALQAASLVFRALTPLAQEELFRSVRISSVSEAERLLEATGTKPLLRCVFHLELDLEQGWMSRGADNQSIWDWLLDRPGIRLLASFTRVTHLKLQGYGCGQAPSSAAIEKLLFYFQAVSHVHIEVYSDPDDSDAVISLLPRLPPSVQYLKVGGLWTEDESPPSSPDGLASHKPQEALPSLKHLVLPSGITPQLIQWFLRSGAANRIRSLTIDPQQIYDLECAAPLLSQGCQQLERLTLIMFYEGWEGLDISLITLPARIKTVQFLHSGLSCEYLIHLLLATLPEDNVLSHVDITTDGGSFENIASSLDDVLVGGRFSKLVRVRVGLGELEDEWEPSDYAALMPLVHERGIFQLVKIKSFSEEFDD